MSSWVDDISTFYDRWGYVLMLCGGGLFLAENLADRDWVFAGLAAFVVAYSGAALLLRWRRERRGGEESAEAISLNDLT